jgi:hypothetical protein
VDGRLRVEGGEHVESGEAGEGSGERRLRELHDPRHPRQLVCVDASVLLGDDHEVDQGEPLHADQDSMMVSRYHPCLYQG